MIRLALCSLLPLCVAAGPATQPATRPAVPPPSYRWTFDEKTDTGSPATASGVKSAALRGGAGLGVGRGGTPGLVLNGTDAYAEIGLDLAAARAASLTVSFWFKPDAAPSKEYANLFESAGNKGLIVRVDPWMRVGVNTSSTWHLIRSEDVRRTYQGPWYHVVVVRRPDSAELYVNGELAGQAADLKAPAFGDRIYIGARDDKAGLMHFFKGAIDDLRLYTAPLSAEQVKALFKEIPTR
jgi:hypothetical protein